MRLEHLLSGVCILKKDNTSENKTEAHAEVEEKGNGSSLPFLTTLYRKIIYDDKGEILRRLPRKSVVNQVKVDSPIAQLVRALH